MRSMSMSTPFLLLGSLADRREKVVACFLATARDSGASSGGPFRLDPVLDDSDLLVWPGAVTKAKSTRDPELPALSEESVPRIGLRSGNSWPE